MPERDSAQSESGPHTGRAGLDLLSQQGSCALVSAAEPPHAPQSHRLLVQGVRPRGREGQWGVLGLGCSHTGLVLSGEGAFLRTGEYARENTAPGCGGQAGNLLWTQLATAHRSTLAAQGE